jgi:hypothetical protein
MMQFVSEIGHFYWIIVFSPPSNLDVVSRECVVYCHLNVTVTIISVRGNLRSTCYIDILGDAMLPYAHILRYGKHYFFQDHGAPTRQIYVSEVFEGPEWDSMLRMIFQNPGLSTIKNVRHIVLELRGTMWSGIRMDWKQLARECVPTLQSGHSSHLCTSCSEW